MDTERRSDAERQEKEVISAGEYIYRNPGSKKITSGKKHKHTDTRCFRIVAAVLAAAVLISGGFGIKLLVKAAQKQEITAATAADPAHLLADGISLLEWKLAEKNAGDLFITEGNVFGTGVYRNTAGEDEESNTGEGLTAVAENGLEPESSQLQSEIDETRVALAAEELTVAGSETLTGLIWNEDLMDSIRERVEAERIEEQEEMQEEDYKELLVTLGMDEDYASSNPVLPEYLTMTYNPEFVINLSSSELSDFLRLVEAEAPSEDIYGKILVANVVLNRVLSDQMANTVTGVIYEKIGGSAQFSPTAIKWYWNSIKVTNSTREAVARCLSGEDYSDGALYFYAWEKHPDKQKTCTWLQKTEYLFTHGGHIFYK